MKTFLNRNVFEKILISFSQPLSTLFILFHFSLHIQTSFQTYKHTQSDTQIDFFDCLIFFRALFLIKKKPSISFLIYPSLTNEDNMSQYFFPIKI